MFKILTQILASPPFQFIISGLLPRDVPTYCVKGRITSYQVTGRLDGAYLLSGRISTYSVLGQIEPGACSGGS